MPRLAESHTVLAVDLRGLGDSDAGEEPNDVPTGANDLALLLANIGAGPAFVAGQDWGGSTAFALATAHPAAVRGLAVIEALPSGPWTGTDSARAGTWFAGLHQVPDLPEALVRGRERTYLEWFYRAYSATPGVPDRQAVDEYLRTYSRPGVMASAFARYRGAEREIAHNAGPARSNSRSSRWEASGPWAPPWPRTCATRHPTSTPSCSTDAGTTSVRNAPPSWQSYCCGSSTADRSHRWSAGRGLCATSRRTELLDEGEVVVNAPSSRPPDRPSNRRMWMCSYAKSRPVGGIPINSPVWIPLWTKCTTTVLPCSTVRWTSKRWSEKAESRNRIVLRGPIPRSCAKRRPPLPAGRSWMPP